VVPLLYLPKPEEPKYPYPDPTIHEKASIEDEYYIEQ
jgi:hypothetical protein